MNKEANEKFLEGDGIDDEELDNLLCFYRELEKYLLELGPEFKLAQKEVTDRFIRLKTYEHFRSMDY